MDHSINFKAQLQKEFLSILPEEDHALYNVAQFHFKDFGKMLRGTTALSVSKVVGLDVNAAIHWGLAVELMHNASLVHDDVCDKDAKRRYNPTIFATFGSPLAICFGDWLVAKSFEHAVIALNNAGNKSNKPISLLSKVMAQLSKGQAREFTGGPVLDWENYNNIVSGKTIPLLAAALEGPLLLADKLEYLDDIRNIIEELGLGYQISNDILDVLGKDGSSIPFNDLNRKAPNAVSITFRNNLKNGHRINFDKWMSNKAQAKSRDWSIEIKRNGAINNCIKHLKHHLNESRKHQDKLPNELQDALLPLVRYLESASTKMYPITKHS